ncbi:response regulator [Candidatus Saccharibacteria bacterium]|nr:response regulator [Candidatus Saccharibacteria bacterium]
MTKIMLVEDDKSLREIYSIRLVAEGYEVVSAGDGEEALAMAVQQRPDLVLSDVMMPKISGFDMLDILRSTPETKDIKVIMMTALSSEDQRQRGENLGADKYLVKSQVGIEDVINAVHEVLGDKITSASPEATAAPEAPTTTEAAPATPAPTTTPETAAPATTPAAAPEVAAPAPEAPATPTPETAPAAAPTTEASTSTPETPSPAPSNSVAMEALLNSAPDSNNASWPGASA